MQAGSTHFLASWMDRDAWLAHQRPLHPLQEFVFATCFTTLGGWSQLRHDLDELLRESPSAKATLVLSLVGLEQTGTESLLDQFAEFSALFPRRCAIYFLDDRDGALFHPKFYACQATDGRTRVVVGSANLTEAASKTNYEAGAIISNQPREYRAVLQSIETLSHNQNVYLLGKEEVERLKRRLRTRRANRFRSASAGLSSEDLPGVDEQSGQISLSHHYTPVGAPATIKIESTMTLAGAFAQVEQLARQGCFVLRTDKIEGFTDSISLKKFRTAKIVSDPGGRPMGAGLSVNRKGTTISVEYLPEDARKEINAVRRSLGSLLGRYTLELVGRRWLPCDWETDFREAWDRTLSELDISKIKNDAENHGRRLAKNLALDDARAKTWAKDLGIQAPSKWDPKLAKKYGIEIKDTQTAAEKRRLAVNVIFRHVRESTKFSIDHVFHLIEAVRSPPSTQQGRLLDADDALHFLHDLAYASLQRLLRRSPAAPSCAVSRVIHSQAHHRRESSGLELLEQVSRWRKSLTRQSGEIPEALLPDAWMRFSKFFRVGARGIDWDHHRPSPAKTSSEESTQESLRATAQALR